MAYLRLPFCSPYKLILPLLKVPTTPADIIHSGYAHYVWQMNGRKVLGRTLLYGLLWPIPFAYLSWKHTRKLGDRVRAATGKGILRQVMEQFSVALRYSISPRKYYVFELFRPERLRHAGSYIARYEFKGGLHTFLESRIELPTRRILNDKAAFFRHCQQNDIATMPTYLVVHSDGNLERLKPFDGNLPPCDLFIKPLKGRGGRGCERWLRQEDGRYRDQNGITRDAAELLAHVATLAADKAMLVQGANIGTDPVKLLVIDMIEHGQNNVVKQ